jgi:UDP-3-O-[3-hydroxymyristoyl] glucosamine N-acyltransferase
MEIAFAPDEIAGIAGPIGRRGGTTETIRGIAALGAAQPGDLSFLGNPKYRPQLGASLASVIFIPPDYPGDPRPNQLYLVVDNPSVALARVCARIEQALWPKPAPGIHPAASVAPGARIPASATVGPLCVVEAGAVIGERTHLQASVFVGRAARIGDDCWLMPGTAVAAECELKNRVRLQPGAIIGSDGFGYEFVGGRHERVPQLGGVVLGDDVEIGANTTIDRGRFTSTTVGEGTKIDNLVQVGHNVAIGRHCLIIAQTGISGSTTLEDYVVLGGQVGTVGHITIGRGTKVGAKSGVNHSLPAGTSVFGNPSLPYMLEQRLKILHQRLPELFKRVGALESRLGAPGGKPE